MITLFRNPNIQSIEKQSQTKTSCFDCASGCKHSNPCPSAYGATYTLPQEGKS